MNAMDRVYCGLVTAITGCTGHTATHCTLSYALKELALVVGVKIRKHVTLAPVQVPAVLPHEAAKSGVQNAGS